MTKVEELRENVLEVSEHLPSDIERQLKRDLDSLISAAHAEGVVEGAEQERLEILKAAKSVKAKYAKEGWCYSIPADVLAPKEADNV